MPFIERVMRAMTHINIGAALGLATWTLGSGWQLATSQMAPPDEATAPIVTFQSNVRPGLQPNATSRTRAGEEAPMRLVPMDAAVAVPVPCQPRPVDAPTALSGDDL